MRVKCKIMDLTQYFKNKTSITYFKANKKLFKR